MNHDRIRSCLVEAGFDAELADGGSTLTLEFKVGERRISLVHELPNELLRVPKFHLADEYAGKLAHVGVNRDGEPGEVCVGDPGSTAVNTDCPERVYLETVQAHVALLTRLIEDPAYNRVEQLREFEAHWDILCRNTAEGLNELFVAWDGHEVEGLQVKPPRADSGTDLRKTPIALARAWANHRQLESVRGIAEWKSRSLVGKALGVRVSGLDPAPTSRDELLPWYFRAVEQADVAGRRELRRLHKKTVVTIGWSFRPRFRTGRRCLRSVGTRTRRAGCRRQGQRSRPDAGRLPHTGLGRCRGGRWCHGVAVQWTWGRSPFFSWAAGRLAANLHCG